MRRPRWSIVVVFAVLAFAALDVVPAAAQTRPDQIQVTILCNCLGHAWEKTLVFYKKNANENLYVQCKDFGPGGTPPAALTADQVNAVRAEINAECTDCNKAWDDYQRKWNTGEDLLKASAATTHAASNEAQAYFREQAGLFGEILEVKGGAYFWLATLRDSASQVIENGIGDLLSEGSTTIIHTAENESLGEVLSVEQMYEWVESARQVHQELADGQAMADQGVSLLGEAVDDYKAALAGSQGCGERDQQAAQQEQVRDKARALMDSWDQSPSGLYRNPTNGQIYDAAAAFKQALDIVSQGQSSNAPVLGAYPFRSSGLTVANVRQGQADQSLTPDQVAAAVASLQSSEALLQQGFQSEIDLFTSVETQVEPQLDELVPPAGS